MYLSFEPDLVSDFGVVVCLVMPNFSRSKKELIFSLSNFHDKDEMNFLNFLE